MFDINLKSEYAPYESNEDFLIETILARAFESGRLQNQPPAHPVDIDNLNDFWEAKRRSQNYKYYLGVTIIKKEAIPIYKD